MHQNQKKTTTKRSNNDSSSSSSKNSAAYELVQASQALQAVQALQHLDQNQTESDIEPLTQDPTLLLTTMAQQPQLHFSPLEAPETIHIQLPLPQETGQIPYGASLDTARTIQVRFKVQS